MFIESHFVIFVWFRNVSHLAEAHAAPLLNNNNSTTAVNKPRWGGSDMCPRCNKAVFMAEKVMGAGKVSRILQDPFTEFFFFVFLSNASSINKLNQFTRKMTMRKFNKMSHQSTTAYKTMMYYYKSQLISKISSFSSINLHCVCSKSYNTDKNECKYHHVMLITLSYHLSLSSIAPGRFSRLHPVSA